MQVFWEKLPENTYLNVCVEVMSQLLLERLRNIESDTDILRKGTLWRWKYVARVNMNQCHLFYKSYIR